MSGSIYKYKLWYRRALLKLLPVRAYILESALTKYEIESKINQIISVDRLYFFGKRKADKPYVGKFGSNRFVAVKNSPGKWTGKIKIKGNFAFVGNQIFVRLLMSNPFSPFNIALVAFFYVMMYIVGLFPFSSSILNILLWLCPLFVTYLFTNSTFQKNYKKEKLYFIKLFKGRKLSESEIETLGWEQ